MYSEKVFDHFHHPRNLGAMADATAVIEVTNPVCGDLLKMWVLVRDGGVSDVKFKVEGCIPAVACASWLTETMIGKPLAELRCLTAEQIELGLGGFPSASRHAGALAVAGLKRALEKLLCGITTGRGLV